MSERPRTRAPPSVASSSASRRHPFVGPDRMRLREQEVFTRTFGREQAHLQPRQQHRLAGLQQDVRGVIAGRSVGEKCGHVSNLDRAVLLLSQVTIQNKVMRYLKRKTFTAAPVSGELSSHAHLWESSYWRG
jgi:hypothetical protein